MRSTVFNQLIVQREFSFRYYTQAYANLEDIRVVDTNCLEIKTVAGFLNYKMCKLMFKLNLPRDAITQFKAHVEKYKSRTGFKDLVFEHYGWTSQQFQYFADLFSDAVKNGLAALQTQHPGIYYLKAAEFVYKRRDTFSQMNGGKIDCAMILRQSLITNS